MLIIYWKQAQDEGKALKSTLKELVVSSYAKSIHISTHNCIILLQNQSFT